MKILVLGGNGMAGHVIRAYLASNPKHQVWSTVREVSFDPQVFTLDVTDHLKLQWILHSLAPDVVINAIGMLNQVAEERIAESIYVNSMLPHLLAQYGKQFGFKVIHISTDCVFSGARGQYTENDVPDGISVYARTKILGELHDDRNLTIRTSIIGPELGSDGIGLFHWFQSQRGTVRGYREVYWNGVTTLELAKAIEWCLNKPVTGLAHLAASVKISKHDLLALIQFIFHRDDVTLVPHDVIKSDKSLLNTRDDFTFPVSPYPEMIGELMMWMTTHPAGRLTDET